MSNKLLIGSFLATTALVTVREFQAHEIPPPPQRYLATGVVFSLLGFVGAANEGLAGALGVGMLIAVGIHGIKSANPGGLPPSGPSPFNPPPAPNPPPASGIPAPSQGQGKNLNPPNSGNTTTTPIM